MAQTIRQKMIRLLLEMAKTTKTGKRQLEILELLLPLYWEEKAKQQRRAKRKASRSENERLGLKGS